MADGPDPELIRARTQDAAQKWHQGTRVTDIQRLPGGQSSLTYIATLADAPVARIVVKATPPGLPPTRHRNLGRQARLLAELSRAGTVPVPELLFHDAGKDGADGLFATAFCAGESFEPNVDVGDDIPPTPELASRALAAAQALAAIHSFRTDARWFGHEPTVSLLDEIERWSAALATLPQEFGLAWPECAEALLASRPAELTPVLTHGDYRLGNMLCAGPDVVAVIDWEIWARGDPRTDLAWFLLSLDGPRYPAAIRNLPGLPAAGDLLAEYGYAGGAPIADLDWFTALSLFKLTATTGLIAKHALRLGDTTAWGIRMAPKLPAILADAKAVADRYAANRSPAP